MVVQVLIMLQDKEIKTKYYYSFKVVDGVWELIQNKLFKIVIQDQKVV